MDENADDPQLLSIAESISDGDPVDWSRLPKDVTPEQYDELYKHLTHDWTAPLTHRHFKIEGTQEFAGLLYVPGRPQFDLFEPDSKHGVRLHVRRVLIMESCEELVPRWPELDDRPGHSPAS